MVNLIIGFSLGFAFAFVVRAFVIALREKKGLYKAKHESLRLSAKFKSIVREIIFKFSIQKFNSDFLLNVKSKNGMYLLQLMHRSHFPELCKSMSDVKFGLAIYVPINPLTWEQRKKLEHILKEESEIFYHTEDSVEFFVVDTGTRVRFTGYLLSRIIKEIFNLEDVDLELYNEGSLPYHYPLKTQGDNN